MQKIIDGDVSHIKGSFLPEDCDEYLERLKKDIPWQKKKWGNFYLPRLIFRLDTSFEEGPEVLRELKDRTEETFCCTVRSVWCNYYKTGKDYTPPHQDNYDAHVITYSFGGTRRFICENLKTKDKTEYLLEDGDIFYFSPKFDSEHKHSIPKTTKEVDERISIVFFTDKPFCQSHWVAEQNTGLEEVLEGDDIIITDGENVYSFNLSSLFRGWNE